ncbi:DUF349 domain-containing protein [Microbacterium sp. CPCC 204701]|uniref:DUF349 domain-containing protein n=1 Tax=Microbacterium sp. CPCC 204701 TaxID=2493084 RepID=UPI00406BF7A0
MTAAADPQPDTDALHSPETSGSEATAAEEVAAAENVVVTAPDDTVAEPPAEEGTPAEPGESDTEAQDEPEGSEADVAPVAEAEAEPAAEPDASVAVAEPPVEAVVEPDAPPAPEPRPAAASPADVMAAMGARPAPRPAASGSGEPWGRVDDDGTVSVREADGWRVVGQYPDGSPAEALAYFERKFADLASEVTLLEVRHRRGGAPASDLRTTARALHAKIEGAAAVGDLASLEARISALTELLSAESATEAAAARQAVDDAVKARIELVEKAEALAARDPRSVQWKQATADVNSLFDQWQSQQQHGPRLPKSTAQQLWKRFRDARATVDKHRRAFYAELDEAHKVVRDRKTRLVEKAEALAPKGEDGIPAYRELLDQWKTAGRAGKKVDDALWARFKAAGDALYGARIEREAADAEASREKIEAKRALLEQAKAVADERDLAKARTLLTSVQRQWDDIGRIFPRDAERVLDDDLRKVEQALRSREETDWKQNDPETKARANDMTRQLMDSIQKLEDELEAAKKSGDKKAITNASEALEARKSWLKAVGG